MNEKFSHKEVDYEHPAQGPHHCSQCVHYRGVGDCEIVQPPIAPEDWCKKFQMAGQRHNVSLYRAMHHLNHGGLHRALHVPEDENIPQAKLERAKHSPNEHVMQMANMASNMEHFNKK